MSISEKESSELLTRADDLQLDQDLRFQRREWRIERVAWWLALLVIVAALAGLFSNGPLSNTSAASPSGDLRVDYQRFARHLGQNSLSITVQPTAFHDGVATIVLDSSIAATLQITSISPQPQSMSSAGGSTVIQVATVGDAPAQVLIQYAAAGAGLHTGTISSGLDRHGADLWEFVYP
ncbi:MAG: hypothetical protein ACTHMW_09285 [Actinomycetes bacterium]